MEVGAPSLTAACPRWGGLRRSGFRVDSGRMTGALGGGAGAALPSDTLALLICSMLKCVPFERGRGGHAGAWVKMGHLL